MMANFLEKPRTFNPYIQQLPLDTYAAVGLQKQMEYNSGVQKVNAYRDSLSALNVARDTDRKYLNDRISSLTSRINEVAADNWGNQALVGQVGSLAGMIYNDPNIQSAVEGTKKYYKDEQDIAEAKKNGKWAPENEWVLRSQMATWLNDPNPGASYHTGGYKPYEDVGADIIKAWKDAKPDSTLVQKPNGDFYAYQTVNNEVVGKDGRTLIQTEIKELNPSEVSEQINALLTPSQRDQLAISGLYQYRGVTDAPGLLKLVDQHFSKSEQYYDNLLSSEKLSLTLNSGNTAALDTINTRIASIEKKKAELLSTKSAYQQSAIQNPDAIKSSIYYEDWLNGIGNMIGYNDSSTKIVDNPSYKAQLEELKIWADLQKSLRAASGKGKGKGKGSGDDDESMWDSQSGVVQPLTQEERTPVNINDFKFRLLQLQEQNDQAASALLYRHFGDRYVNHIFRDLNNDGIAEEVFTLKNGMEKEAALTMAAWWEKFRKGDPDLDITVSETLRDLDEKKLLASRLAAVTNDVEQRATDYVKGQPSYQKAQVALKSFNAIAPALIAGAQVTPNDVKNYLQLRSEKLKPGASGGIGGAGTAYIPEMTDQELGHYGLTREKFSALQKADAPRAAAQDVASFERMVGSLRPALQLMEEADKQRQAFISQEVRKYQGIFNRVAIAVPSAKAEEMRPVANFVQSLSANAKQTGMGGTTDWSQVRAMVGEKHAAETVYSYVQDRDGNVKIRVANVDVDNGRPQEIEVDRRTAQINNIASPDPLSVTRSLLDLGEGIRTGNTFEQSIPLNNGRTGRYSVRHEVENFGGRYKVKLYVTDNLSPDKQTKQLPINATLFADWNKLSNFLQNDVNERFIQSLLNPTAQGPGTFSPGQFPGNSLISQFSPSVSPQP